MTSLWEGKRRASSDLPPKSSKAKSEYAITCSTTAQLACVGPCAHTAGQMLAESSSTEAWHAAAAGMAGRRTTRCHVEPAAWHVIGCQKVCKGCKIGSEGQRTSRGRLVRRPAYMLLWTRRRLGCRPAGVQLHGSSGAAVPSTGASCSVGCCKPVKLQSSRCRHTRTKVHIASRAKLVSAATQALEKMLCLKPVQAMVKAVQRQCVCQASEKQQGHCPRSKLRH